MVWVARVPPRDRIHQRSNFPMGQRQSSPGHQTYPYISIFWVLYAQTLLCCQGVIDRRFPVAGMRNGKADKTP
jgi:hypothetical protein